MTYAELGKAYPDLKVQFDSFQLTTVCIETDELEMIEEMFSRLNESAPLTAPEKGTPMVDHCQARSGNWLRVFLHREHTLSEQALSTLRSCHEVLVRGKRRQSRRYKKAYLDRFVETSQGNREAKCPRF